MIYVYYQPPRVFTFMFWEFLAKQGCMLSVDIFVPIGLLVSECSLVITNRNERAKHSIYRELFSK